MNRKEKKALTTCNKKGLVKLINDPDYAQNKANQFPAIVGYLARHGLPGGSTKEELMDLIYAARNELIAQEAKKHADSKNPIPYELQGPNANRVKDFIRNPISAIIREMQAFHNSQVDFSNMEPDEAQYYANLKTNASTLVIELQVMESHKGKYEDKVDMIDVVSRLSKKMPEKDADLGASIKRVNSGLFGTLFRRPSKEFTAFKESFDMFRDADKAHSGNVEDLEAKATAYLKHVIPEFKYSKDMPKEQWLACLPKGKRARADLCMKVLESIDEHKQMKPYMENVEKAAKGQPVVEQPAPIKEEVVQQKFQDDLQKEIEPVENKNDQPEVQEAEPQVQQGDLGIK